jgi:hypothetical protein
MKNAIVLLAVAALSPSAVLLSTSGTTGVSLVQNADAITIKNSTNQPITAYAVTMVRGQLSGPGSSRSASRIFYDGVTTKAQRPIAAGQERALPIAVPSDSDARVTLRSVMFSDGSTSGDPAWVSLIKARRGSYAVTIQAILDAVHAGQAAAETPGQITDRLAKVNSELLASARTKRSVDGKAYSHDIFEETSEDRKSANLRVVSDDELMGATTRLFGIALNQLNKPDSTADSVTHVIQYFESNKSSIANAPK